MSVRDLAQVPHTFPRSPATTKEEPTVIELCGKAVRDTLDELLNPPTTALVVIDMQVSGLKSAQTQGSMLAGVIERCGAAISAARENGVPIFHIRVENYANGASSSPAWLRNLHIARNASGLEMDICQLSLIGDPGNDFVPECMPIDGETVITKRRQSAFVSTDLALLLRGSGIESVALIGVTTAGCVEATIRDAVHNDFYAVLIEDAVGASDLAIHEAGLAVMRSRHDHTTVDNMIEVWQRASARAS